MIVWVLLFLIAWLATLTIAVRLLWLRPVPQVAQLKANPKRVRIMKRDPVTRKITHVGWREPGHPDIEQARTGEQGLFVEE